MAFFKDSQATAFDVGRNNKHEVEMVPDDYAFSTLSAEDPENHGSLSGKKAGNPNYYVDGTDALANRGLTINLVHVPTGTGVRFKAFLMAFNESYNSDWSSESVYGRADPIHMFKQTSRNISLAWKIVAATEGEAIENLVRLQRFLQMLYPTYTEKNSAQTINQSPLVRLQMSNMIRKAATPKTHDGLSISDTSTALDTGLLGIIKNVSVTHNMENPEVGVFELGRRGSSAGYTTGHPTNNIVPKAIEVQMDFSVVHEHMLGWTKNNAGEWTFGGGAEGAASDAAAFPYYAKDGPGPGNSSDLGALERTNARAAWTDSTRIGEVTTESYQTTANRRAAYAQALQDSNIAGTATAAEIDISAGGVDFQGDTAGGVALTGAD